MSASRSSFHLPLGERGEMIGWGYLVRHGYKILEKNYRVPIGEIDCIAMKGKRLIFIEIKTRSQEQFGTPQEAVDLFKQKKILRTAEWYLKQTRQNNVPVSFHVLAVTWRGVEDPEIRLIEDAFTADSERNELS